MGISFGHVFYSSPIFIWKKYFQCFRHCVVISIHWNYKWKRHHIIFVVTAWPTLCVTVDCYCSCNNCIRFSYFYACTLASTANWLYHLYPFASPYWWIMNHFDLTNQSNIFPCLNHDLSYFCNGTKNSLCTISENVIPIPLQRVYIYIYNYVDTLFVLIDYSLSSSILCIPFNSFLSVLVNTLMVCSDRRYFYCGI